MSPRIISEDRHPTLRDTDRILRDAAKTLDFGQPVAIMLIAVLHCIPDSDDPHAIVRSLLAAVPPGSYVALSHPGRDLGGANQGEMYRRLNEVNYFADDKTSAPATPRSGSGS